MADSLFRVAVKSLIFNQSGELLVVKESGRTTWGLPGGGIEYGEDIKTALARELHEEVNLDGDFTYEIFMVAEPKVLVTRPVHQINLIFHVVPAILPDGKGADADDARYIDPILLGGSEHANERAIYEYAKTFKG